MQATETLNEGLHREFEVTVEAAAITKSMNEKLAEIGQTAKIPGFRPGKIPTTILKQRYGQSVMGEVVESVVRESSAKALEDVSIKPAMQPNIEITKFEEGEDLIYKMSVDILPEIEIGDFSKLELERPVAEVTDEEITKAMEMIQGQNKVNVKIDEDRGAENGDVVFFDFAGTVDGEARDGMAAEGHELELGSGQFIPGFEEQLIGMKAGEKKDVTVTFPEDYHAEDLAGKEAIFACTLHELRAPQTPELNDEFAERMGLKDLAELREKVVEQLEGNFKEISRDVVKRDMMDKLAEEYTFDVPKGMVDMEFEQIWRGVSEAIEKDGLTDEDKAKSEDELKEEYRGIAERRVRLGLLFAEVGTKNEVEVTEQEVTQAIFKEAQRYPGQAQQVFEYYTKTPEALAQLRAPIFEEKVVDLVLELANVTDKTVSVEELTGAEEEEHVHGPDCDHDHDEKEKADA
ncbi:MAG: trigger factor [Alphaproteobacteria bacterium]